MLLVGLFSGDILEAIAGACRGNKTCFADDTPRTVQLFLGSAPRQA